MDNPFSLLTSGFLVICIDTGAATSVGGREQHEEYLKSVLIPSSVRKLSSSVKRFRFGATINSSLGRAMIRMPFQALNSTNHSESISFTFAMDIVDLDVPLLLGLDVIMACGATVDMSSMTLRLPSWTAYVELRDGRIFVPPTHCVIRFLLSSCALFTENSHILQHPNFTRFSRKHVLKTWNLQRAIKSRRSVAITIHAGVLVQHTAARAVRYQMTIFSIT
jgi:hypothetical protein